MLSPILEKVAEDASTKTGSGASVDLVTIDTDQEVELGQKYEVRRNPHTSVTQELTYEILILRSDRFQLSSPSREARWLINSSVL